MLCFTLGLFYLFSIFIYFDFGSYIKMEHVQLLLNHGGKEDILYTIFSFKGIGFLFLSLMIWYISKKINKQILKKSSLKIISAKNLSDAAKKIVEAIK